MFHDVRPSHLLQICRNKWYNCDNMKIDELLKQHNLRLTKPRQQVFEVLQQSAVPLTISDIAKKCKNVDRASVYRTLVTFDQLHIVSAVAIGWKNYYELAEPFIPHHHHLYCIRCQNAEPIQTPELEQLVGYLSRKHQFAVVKHHFELEGICKNCQKHQTK